MDFFADLELPTLLQTCAARSGGALMPAKQAACDVAAMFGVTPRQNLKPSNTRLPYARVLPFGCRAGRMDPKQYRGQSYETGLRPHTDINSVWCCAEQRGVAGCIFRW